MSHTSTATGWLSLFGPSRQIARADDRKRQRFGLKVESLETRDMMSVTPIQFNIPADVLPMGVYASFSSQLTADYVDKTNATIPNGTYVYYDNALQDYAAIASGDAFTFQLTASGQQVQLPNTPVKGGEISIGIGSPPVVTDTGSGLSVPSPSTSPTNIFGLVEYAYTTQLDLDMSEIDQVGFPFTITSNPAAASPAQDGVGLNLNRGEFFDRYTPFIVSQGSTAAPFEQLLADGLPYRLLAPQDALSGQNSAVLNPPTLAFGGALTANTTYYYWVTGTNQYGETTPSNYQQVVTAPKSINGHNVSQRTVNLNWTAVDGATGYNIYRSESSDVSTALWVGTSPTLTYQDAGSPPLSLTQHPPTNDYTFNPLASYFNGQIDAFFTYYQSHDFVLDRDGHTFTGRVDTDYSYESHDYTVLKLTSPDFPGQDFLVFQPYFQENTNMPDAPPAPSWMVDASDSPGEMIFGASGSFADGVEQYPSNAVLAGIQKDIENDIDAAFNRGIANNYAIAPSDWADDPSLFYAPGSTSNWYAAFLHTDITTQPNTGVSINGLAYGFAYDDNGGTSTNFQGNFSLVNINLMPWGDSPVPHGSAASIVFLTQPENARVGSHESVQFQVRNAQGQPFQGGAFVIGNLEGAESGAYTMVTDPVTGIGTMTFENSVAGVSHIQLSLMAGPGGGSPVTAESNNFIVSNSGPGTRWPRCAGTRGTSSHSMLVESALHNLGLM